MRSELSVEGRFSGLLDFWSECRILVLNTLIMEPYEKILVLNNEYEAGMMEEVLTDRGIPFGIVTSDDSALGGIIGLENGWGYVEAPASRREEVTRLYKEIARP